MKKKTEPRRYESEMLGMPPLKMVLINTDAIRREGQTKARTLRKLGKNAKNRTVIEKLINHLKEMDK